MSSPTSGAGMDAGPDSATATANAAPAIVARQLRRTFKGDIESAIWPAPFST